MQATPALRTVANRRPSWPSVKPPTWPVRLYQARQGSVTVRFSDVIHRLVPTTAAKESATSQALAFAVHKHEQLSFLSHISILRTSVGQQHDHGCLSKAWSRPEQVCTSRLLILSMPAMLFMGRQTWYNAIHIA